MLTLPPIQQSCSRRHLKKILFTLLKEMNIFFKLENFENIVTFVTMFSHVICCSRRKNEYLWSKGLMIIISNSTTFCFLFLYYNHHKSIGILYSISVLKIVLPNSCHDTSCIFFHVTMIIII